ETGMAQRRRGDGVALADEADQREITGAATKIGDQDQRVGLEPLRIIKRRADRLVDIGRRGDADTAIGFAIALRGPRPVGHGTGRPETPGAPAGSIAPLASASARRKKIASKSSNLSRRPKTPVS